MKNFNPKHRGGGNRGSSSGARFSGRKGFGRPSFGRSDDRQMFETTCSECGKTARVPFRPTGDKPVFCRECFAKQGDGQRGGFQDRDNRPREHQGAPQAPRPQIHDSRIDEIKKQLERMDIKLNQIIEFHRGTEVRKSLEEAGSVKPKAKSKAKPKAKTAKKSK